MSTVRIDQLRAQFGHVHERRQGGAIAIYAPGWLPLYYALKHGRESGHTEERTQRKQRIEEIELRTKELDLAAREGQLVSVDEFLRDRLGPCVDEIRAGVELVGRWPDAQRILMEQLNRGIERLQANGSTHHLTGDRQTGSGGSDPLDSEDCTQPPRVRKAAHRNAGRRTKRG